MIKNKILIIGNYPPPYGGVPNHIERLTDYLSKNNWDCHILAGGMSGITRKNNITVYKPELIDKIKSIIGCILSVKILKNLFNSGFSLKNARQILRYAAYYKYGENLIKNENIKIIASYNLYANSPIGYWLSKKYNLPHAINVFGEIYKNAEHFKKKSIFFNEILNSANCLISCSEHCGESIKLLNNKKSINIVTYGVDLKHFNYEASKRIKNDKKVILFVGRQSKEMGVDTFVNLALNLEKKYEDIEYWVVGQKGDYSEKIYYFTERKNSKIKSFVTYPYTDLPKLYASAQILIVPTRGTRTCSSLATMEAMSLGIAVIAYDIGGISELIVNRVDGLLVDYENENKLQEKTEEVLNSLSLRKAISENAYRKAIDSFDENRMNQKFELLYSQIINQ